MIISVWFFLLFAVGFFVGDVWGARRTYNNLLRQLEREKAEKNIWTSRSQQLMQAVIKHGETLPKPEQEKLVKSIVEALKE